jgi:hypothetical protein
MPPAGRKEARGRSLHRNADVNLREAFSRREAWEQRALLPTLGEPARFHARLWDNSRRGGDGAEASAGLDMRRDVFHERLRSLA